MPHLHSQQFIRMVAEGNTADIFNGDYQFSTLASGLSLHGGHFVAEKTLQLSHLAPPYISFLILFEGELDFALNQHRHRISAESGKILLIAAERESLFCRYLHRGQTTCKLTLKGLEKWLDRPPYQQHLPGLYSTAVRHWPLPPHIAELAQRCLPCADGNRSREDVAYALRHEAGVLQLLAALWQDYRARYPAVGRENSCQTPDTPFADNLNRAFADGAHHAAALAAALCMSERTLQRRLQSHFGLSVGQWLRHKHMQYALHELTTRHGNIGEIAWRCGYRQTSAFIRAFKKYFGCTPATLRTRYKAI